MNRDSERKSVAAVAQMGHVEILYYGKEKLAGLRKVKVSDIANIRSISEKCLPTIGDFMWLYGKWACIPGIPGWNGFMEEATANNNFVRSKIMFLPFINVSPSDYDIHDAHLCSYQEEGFQLQILYRYI
ncbi:lmbr1 domain-containing protein 2-like protein [Lasius niger]|uniref:Lmbr1 domain-containing protein 2-like protein n=1 Tax=Lasius niger TaxID=67767 RepID=A0A0J7JW14_LASNI|nr:lmbr1 domain-containing protein 2-like protein [Lasius niger]